jgi:hypothetical protein
MNPRTCGAVRTVDVDAPTIAQNVGVSTIEQMLAGQNVGASTIARNVGRRNVRGPTICTFVSSDRQK